MISHAPSILFGAIAILAIGALWGPLGRLPRAGARIMRQLAESRPAPGPDRSLALCEPIGALAIALILILILAP
jgi:hypothetical protein